MYGYIRANNNIKTVYSFLLSLYAKLLMYYIQWKSFPPRNEREKSKGRKGRSTKLDGIGKNEQVEGGGESIQQDEGGRRNTEEDANRNMRKKTGDRR